MNNNNHRVLQWIRVIRYALLLKGVIGEETRGRFYPRDAMLAQY